MKKKSIRSLEVTIEAGCLLLVSAFALIFFDRYMALSVFPLVWVAALLLRGSFAIGLTALTSHLLVILIALVRSGVNVNIEVLFGTYSASIQPTNSSYFLLFWYLPALYVFLQVDVEGLLQRPSGSNNAFSKQVRRGAIVLSSVLIWRDRLRQRYQIVMETLRYRGFNAKRFFAPILLVHIWLPLVASSVVFEAVEYAEQSRRFPVNINSWSPQQSIKRLQFATVLIRLAILLVVAVAAWMVGSNDLLG